MNSKEDCPLKWSSISLYVIGIINLYYSFNEYSTLYGIYKEYYQIEHFDFHYNFLMSIQYLILCVVILFIGVITDKYGPGFCFLLQGAVITIGQLLACLSVYTKIFYIMYLARFLVVIGSSSIAVSKGVYCRDYFLSTHLALTNSMTSLSFTLSQIGNLYFVWLIYNSYGLLAVEFFAVGLNLLGFIITYFIYDIDKKNNQKLSLYNFKKDNIDDEPNSLFDNHIESENDNKIRNDTQIDHIDNNCVQHRKSSAEIKEKKQQIIPKQNKKELPLIGQYLKDMSTLKYSYWLGCLTIAIAYLSLNTYVVLGPAICQQYLKISPQQSSFYVSFLPNITLVMPLIGRIVDHYKSWFNIYYAMSFLAITGTIFLILKVPILAFTFIGLAYGTRTSAEFPLICFLVDKKIAGRAYSIARATSMLSISLILFLNSFLAQETGSYYFTLLLLFTTSVLISILITIVKYRYFKEQGQIQHNEYKELKSNNQLVDIDDKE